MILSFWLTPDWSCKVNQRNNLFRECCTVFRNYVFWSGSYDLVQIFSDCITYALYDNISIQNENQAVEFQSWKVNLIDLGKRYC